MNASLSVFVYFFYDYIAFVLDCNQPTLIGDGYCNDEVNIFDCNYDGGDCCGSCVITSLCTDCACIGNVTGNGILNALVGDGYCNDETNTQQCNFDGGDCCLNQYCINTDLCTNCSCIGRGKQRNITLIFKTTYAWKKWLLILSNITYLLKNIL